MDQPKSGWPARASHAARRSLAEFALPACDAPMPVATAGQSLLTTEPAMQQDERPAKALESGSEINIPEPLNEDQRVVARRLQPTDDLNGVTSEDKTLLQQFEDMTSVAAKAAKDYRSRMLEQMKIKMCAALDYANNLASVNPWITSAAHHNVLDREQNSSAQGGAETTAAIAKIADAYRAKAFELMTANMKTTLDYALQMVYAKTPFEFLELSTDHARKQFELLMRETAELGSIAQRLTAPNVERMTVDLVKPLGEKGNKR